MNNSPRWVDFAAQQFLHKLFVPRPGVDRCGRMFDPLDMPSDDHGRPSTELARRSQSLSVEQLVSKGSNPSDDIYLVKTSDGAHGAVRMQWLRLYWQEAAREAA
jgi:hypothetical protein